VILSHRADFNSKPQITLDDQHGESKWFDLSMAAKDEKLYPYMSNDTGWFLNRIGQYK
jgi:hypothetical protein